MLRSGKVCLWGERETFCCFAAENSWALSILASFGVWPWQFRTQSVWTSSVSPSRISPSCRLCSAYGQLACTCWASINTNVLTPWEFFLCRSQSNCWQWQCLRSSPRHNWPQSCCLADGHSSGVLSFLYPIPCRSLQEIILISMSHLVLQLLFHWEWLLDAVCGLCTVYNPDSVYVREAMR